ncbi:Proteasomal ubiquitin receptor ADRM1 [Dirofilaria immitis]|nr:Proteasomal ubiquitin receptor ADRM1 [Dirofilaria immitis]
MSVMFANSRSSQANSGYLVEFKNQILIKAGRSNLQAGSTVDKRKVVADKTKGLIFIKQSSDQLMHFCWKNRETGTVVDDLIIFPGDTEFLRVKECTDGRVYMLKFKSTDEKRLFWMQDGKTDKDDENCKKVIFPFRSQFEKYESLFGLLNLQSVTPTSSSTRGADRAGASSFGTLAALGSAGADSELGALGNLDQNQLMQLLSLMNHTNSASASEAANLLPQLPLSGIRRKWYNIHAGATPSNTPANGIIAGSSSNNAVQLSQLKEIIASITPPDGSIRKPSVDFTDVLCCADKINDVLGKYAERLIPHLPNQEPIYNNQEELQQTLRTPQFRQAVDIFGHALQTGQLAPILRQFGIDSNTAIAAGNGDLIAWATQFTTSENEKEIAVKTETLPFHPGMESDVEDEETNEKAVRESDKNRTDDHMDLD